MTSCPRLSSASVQPVRTQLCSKLDAKPCTRITGGNDREGAGSDMRGMVAALVDELRNVGIPVSVGEHLDAASAVSQVPLRDKEVLRAALQCALVKNSEHLSTFNLIFELYTAGTPRTGEGPLAGLSDEQLRDALRGVIRTGESILRSLLAAEYVRRFAGLEAGRPVAGVMYNLAANEAADLEGIRDELLGGDLDG